MNPGNACGGARIPAAILSLFLLTLLTQPLMAQTQSLSGTVVDTTGAVIPQASVKITDIAKGVTRELMTDSAGPFNATDVQPGRYQVAVEKAGFKKAEVTLTLDVNAKVDVGKIELIPP